MGAAIGELVVVQEHFHRYQLPPAEEMCQVCRASRWKDVRPNCCCRSGKVVFARLLDSPQESKHLFEDLLYLVKVRSYNSLFAFTSKGASLAENAQIDEQPANTQQGV